MHGRHRQVNRGGFRFLFVPNPAHKKRVAFEILGLDHVVLRVKDSARVMRFYCSVLGCHIEREQPNLGLIQLRAGQSLIDLVAVDGELGRAKGAAPQKEGRNMDHLCLRVEPFDQEAIVAHLKKHGVAVGDIRNRFGAEGSGISIYLADPEGNTVELKGPPDS